MKAEFTQRRFIISVLILGIVGFGIAFGGDVIVKEGSEYLAEKLGIGTTSPMVALEIDEGEVLVTGSDADSGDATDVLVVTGGTGEDVYPTAGKGSDISFTAGDGGEIQGTGTGGLGGDVAITAGTGGGRYYYYGTCASGGNVTITGGEGGAGTYVSGGIGGKITITSGAGGSAFEQDENPGDSGNIEITVGEPGEGYYTTTGDYGNILLAKNGGYVGIGTDSPSSELDVAGTVTMDTLVLPVKSTTGDPASPVEGQIYVNTYDNKVRVYADGAWRDLTTW